MANVLRIPTCLACSLLLLMKIPLVHNGTHKINAQANFSAQDDLCLDLKKLAHCNIFYKKNRIKRLSNFIGYLFESAHVQS